MSDPFHYRDEIVRRMKEAVRATLTSREDDDGNEFPPFTDEEIDRWILLNISKITTAANLMVSDYIANGAEGDLSKLENDWIREYTYPAVIRPEDVNKPDFVLEGYVSPGYTSDSEEDE